MPISPNPDNYTLGKGRVLFDGRDLGNVPEFNTNISLEKLQHFASRSGKKKLDKTIILSVTPKCSFVLEELSADNIALATLANTEKIIQSAEDISGQLVGVNPGLSYKAINTSDATRKFRIGINKLRIGTVTDGPFVDTESITGGTSSATADIVKVSTGELILENISGEFAAGETITGSTSTATATTGGTVIFDMTDLVVSVSSTPMTMGTDYTVDGKNGYITIIPGGGINQGDDVDFSGSCEAYNYTRFMGFTESSFTGPLTFIPDVEEGNNVEMNFHKVDLTPSGDLASIGEEITKVNFEAEILDDSINHPDSPFMDGYIDDVGI